MTRLSTLDPAQWDPELRAMTQADTMNAVQLGATRVLAHSPGVAKAVVNFGGALFQSTSLPRRLIELVRLRVAFHNQCRTCMAIRYQSAIDEGVTEDLVCSLEKPFEAPDLSARERAAIAFADISSTNHFAINDDTFAELGEHFTEAEIVELGAFIAYFIGFGRFAAALDMTEDLPAVDGDASGKDAPWRQQSVSILNW